MAKTKNSKKGKGTYAAYKADNRAYKNKVKKFERIVKQHPNDEEAKKTLDKLKKGPQNFKHKSRPLVVGSNPTISKKCRHVPVKLETPGEQLSRLLNIPLPKPKYRKRGKTSVTVKKRKDVKKS